MFIYTCVYRYVWYIFEAINSYHCILCVAMYVCMIHFWSHKFISLYLVCIYVCMYVRYIFEAINSQFFLHSCVCMYVCMQATCAYLSRAHIHHSPMRTITVTVKVTVTIMVTVTVTVKIMVTVTVTITVTVTDNLLRYSSYRKTPPFTLSICTVTNLLFRAPLHEVLPTLLRVMCTFITPS